MRILGLCHRLDRTGAPIILFRLLRGLARRHEVELLKPTVLPPGALSLAPDYEAAGIPLRDRARFGEHDVLLINTLLGARGVAAAAGRVATLWWIHEPRGGRQLVRDAGALTRTFRQATRIVFPTRWQGESVYADLLAGRPYSVVPYGIDTDPAARPSPFERRPGEVHMLQLGAVSRRKGVDLSLAALECLADPRLHLHMVGGLGLNPEVSQQYLDHVAARPALRDTVHFHDSQPEQVVNAFIQHCDFMLFPTRDDLITLTILEGLFFGKCVVSSDYGPIPETLIDGETGLTFPVGDADALARCIRRAADDPALVARIGRAGRAIYEQKHGFAAHLAGMEAELAAAVAAHAATAGAS